MGDWLVEQKCNFSSRIIASTLKFCTLKFFLPPARAAWWARDQSSGQKPGAGLSSWILIPPKTAENLRIRRIWKWANALPAWTGFHLKKR
jgi:hypothetical protein